MLVIPHKRLGYKFPAYWFAEHESQIPKTFCFWLRGSYFCPFDLCQHGYKVVQAQWWHTLVTDLTQPLQKIYEAFDKKSTQYSLRRAERLLTSNVEWRIMRPAEHDVEDDRLIADFYKRKGLDSDMFRDLSNAPTRLHWLSSRVVFEDGIVIVHTYLCDKKAGIVRLLYAVSRDVRDDARQDVGNANRWLFWQDLQYFKEEGYRTYDWGGISKHGELPGIDSFKRSFGGSLVTVYSALVCRRSLAPLLRMLWRARTGDYPQIERYEGNDISTR